MNLFKKYISSAKRAKIETLKQSQCVSKYGMFLEYKRFMRWLNNQTMTAEEIKEENPKLFKDIHSAVEAMDSCFNKENYRGFTEGMKRVRNLYLEAVHKNIERGK